MQRTCQTWRPCWTICAISYGWGIRLWLGKSPRLILPTNQRFLWNKSTCGTLPVLSFQPVVAVLPFLSGNPRHFFLPATQWRALGHCCLAVDFLWSFPTGWGVSMSRTSVRRPRGCQFSLKTLHQRNVTGWCDVLKWKLESGRGLLPHEHASQRQGSFDAKVFWNKSWEVRIKIVSQLGQPISEVTFWRCETFEIFDFLFPSSIPFSCLAYCPSDFVLIRSQKHTLHIYLSFYCQ